MTRKVDQIDLLMGLPPPLPPRGKSWKWGRNKYEYVVFDHSFEAHLRHIRHVFEILRQHRLHLHLKKCGFCKTAMEFLRHSISNDIVSMDKQKVEAIVRWLNDQLQLRNSNHIWDWLATIASSFIILPLSLLH